MTGVASSSSSSSTAPAANTDKGSSGAPTTASSPNRRVIGSIEFVPTTREEQRRRLRSSFGGNNSTSRELAQLNEDQHEIRLVGADENKKDTEDENTDPATCSSLLVLTLADGKGKLVFAQEDVYGAAAVVDPANKQNFLVFLHHYPLLRQPHFLDSESCCCLPCVPKESDVGVPKPFFPQQVHRGLQQQQAAGAPGTTKDQQQLLFAVEPPADPKEVVDRINTWALLSCSGSISLSTGVDTAAPRSKTSTRKILFFLNPKSGSGKSLKLWERKLKPLLEQKFQLDVDFVPTQYAGHAREFVGQKFGAVASRNDPTSRDKHASYDAIAVLSGDGLVHEIYQGLYDCQLQNDRDANDSSYGRENEKLIHNSPLATPIAHIPAGSGNALVSTLLALSKEPLSVESAALALVKNRKRDLDLWKLSMFDKSKSSPASRTTSTTPPPRPFFLHLTIGILADLDLESEWLRCIGSLRFTLYAVRNLIKYRVYTAEVEYQGDEVFKENVAPCTAAEKRFQGVLERTKIVWLPTNASTQPPTASPNVLPPWKKISQTHFTMLWATSLPLCSEIEAPCPAAKCDDGFLWLLFCSGDIGRVKLAQVLLSLEQGTILELLPSRNEVTESKPATFRLFRCSGLRVNCNTGLNGKNACTSLCCGHNLRKITCLDVDGEKVELAPRTSSPTASAKATSPTGGADNYAITNAVEQAPTTAPQSSRTETGREIGEEPQLRQAAIRIDFASNASAVNEANQDVDPHDSGANSPFLKSDESQQTGAPNPSTGGQVLLECTRLEQKGQVFCK
ncbi:unnamed protein product [Amoebophrya sp. A120]|nr:unnamed protein product [Amoebophrya sp. A120]|eukprot:GSA120T00009313001.1